MFTIRDDQMRVLDQAANESLCRRLMNVVKQQFPERVPTSDPELRASVEGWIGDARLWGFNTEQTIAGYVLCCAENLGRREPIESRLQVFVRLYHEQLVHGVDLPAFAATLVAFAREHRVFADEGMAWLAVLILAGHARGDNDIQWIANILDQPTLDEEMRMHQVHRQASVRGWIASGGVT